MRTALIGGSGFVGGTLRRQAHFDALYNSRDIETIDGQHFDLVVCAGAPAAKWIANKEPAADRANLAGLMRHLERVTARSFLLVSTVDVYPDPVGVDEASAIDPAAGSAYGRHRFELERFCRDRFGALVVRLPALFGAGLKKNAVYDLLHDNCLDLIQPRSSFQFYDLSRLWGDVERVRRAGVDIVNFAVEPVTLAEIGRVAFGRELPENPRTPVARYDFRTRHAALWGRSDGYAYGRDDVLRGLSAFVVAERDALRGGR